MPLGKIHGEKGVAFLFCEDEKNESGVIERRSISLGEEKLGINIFVVIIIRLLLFESNTGCVIVAMNHGFYSLDLETERFTTISDPEEHLPDQRFNDGKCDAAGRFWAGTMHMNVDNSPTGKLYCLNPDFTVKEVLDNIYCSNGTTWNADSTTMYYIDSPTKQVSAFDFHLNSGEISNRRTAVVIPPNGGVPDGKTIDEEGMLWVAQWGGSQVSRWNPLTGEMLEAIPIPAAHVTSCTFGGIILKKTDRYHLIHCNHVKKKYNSSGYQNKNLPN